MANINNLFVLLDKLGLNSKKISEATGISTGNISDWKNGRSLPTSAKLCAIADYLDCSIDYLLGRTDNPNVNTEPFYQPEPANIIQIPLSSNKASAGDGYDLFDETQDYIDIDINVYPKANLAISIFGNSMLPRYSDGDIVLIHIQPVLENGQIGIFIVDGKGYIKKFQRSDNGNITLVSINPMYPNIPISINNNFKVVGRVLYTL